MEHRTYIEAWAAVRYEMNRDDPTLLVGTIQVTPALIVAINRLAEVDLTDERCQMNGKRVAVADLKDGDTVRITLYPNVLRRELGCIHYELLADLIEQEDEQEPDLYYVYDINFLKGISEVPEQITAYRNSQQFIELLKILSDHTFPGVAYLIENEKLEISLNYTATDIRLLKNIEEVLETLGSADDKQERRRILRNIVFELAGKVDTPRRLPMLLASYDHLMERYRIDREMYLDRFGIQSLRRDFKNEQIDYLKKLSKVFSDIQVKLLSIPGALVLVMAQFDMNPASFSIKNLALVIGTFLYSGIIWAVLGAQDQILFELRDSFDDFEQKLKAKYPDFHDEINHKIRDLRRRHRVHRMLMNGIFTILVVLPVVALVLFVLVL